MSHGTPDIGQETHLDGLDTLALAGLAAPPATLNENRAGRRPRNRASAYWRRRGGSGPRNRRKSPGRSAAFLPMGVWSHVEHVP